MTRNLCYDHHRQEFDKLPNQARHQAAYFLTVEPGSCELCNTETLAEALGIAIAALRQYAAGKTWRHIATDALEELERRGLIGGSHGKEKDD